MKEVRKDTRLSARCPVTYVQETSSGQGMTFNISRYGCAIESEEMA